VRLALPAHGAAIDLSLADLADATHCFLTSGTLAADHLATIAAGLKPGSRHQEQPKARPAGSKHLSPESAPTTHVKEHLTVRRFTGPASPRAETSILLFCRRTHSRPMKANPEPDARPPEGLRAPRPVHRPLPAIRCGRARGPCRCARRAAEKNLKLGFLAHRRVLHVRACARCVAHQRPSRAMAAGVRVAVVRAARRTSVAGGPRPLDDSRMEAPSGRPEFTTSIALFGSVLVAAGSAILPVQRRRPQRSRGAPRGPRSRRAVLI